MIKRAALAFTVLTVFSDPGFGQSPSTIYTWAGSGNVQSWIKNFGTNTATLDNTIPGELRITETGGSGTDVAISDGANRVRESTPNSSGGLDLTGLDFLEFEIGHSGAGPIPVQFFVQASPGFSYVGLGPDLIVQPGVATYQVPLTALTPEQAVYIRTLGFMARNHAAVGDVTWSLREVRAGGTPLMTRMLITHDTGTAEGGLQGAIANFDIAAIQGNNGGQNQTGLSHNPSGSGSLQWTDLGGSAGAAISWGNGTAWNGNTFNMRTTDLSNYTEVIFRMSAKKLTPSDLSASVGASAFFQTNNFTFQSVDGGLAQQLPTDGLFHDLSFPLTGLANMNVVDLTGINFSSHAGDLLIDVDSIWFIPEPSTGALVWLITTGALTLRRVSNRRRFP